MTARNPKTTSTTPTYRWLVKSMDREPKAEPTAKKPAATALYFAYGSNMNRRQMATRCPDAVVVGRGVLRGWRLVERLFADIERGAAGDEVWGVVWAVTDDCVERLDRYEGYPSLYDRLDVRVCLLPVAGKGKPVDVKACVYAMTPKAKKARDGAPYTPWYRHACSYGARENGLPVDAFAGGTAKLRQEALGFLEY